MNDIHEVDGPIVASGRGLSIWKTHSNVLSTVCDDLLGCVDMDVRREIIDKELSKARSMKDRHSLYVAELLYECRKNEYYKQLDTPYDTFKEYTEKHLGYGSSATAANLAATYYVFAELCDIPDAVLATLNFSKAQIVRSYLKENPDQWEEVFSVMDNMSCEQLREWVKSKKTDSEVKPYVIHLKLDEDQAEAWKEAKRIVGEDLGDPMVRPAFVVQQVCREYLASKTSFEGMNNLGAKLLNAIRLVEEAFHVNLAVVSADPNLWGGLIDADTEAHLLQAVSVGQGVPGGCSDSPSPEGNTDDQIGCDAGSDHRGIGELGSEHRLLPTGLGCEDSCGTGPRISDI